MDFRGFEPLRSVTLLPIVLSILHDKAKSSRGLFFLGSHLSLNIQTLVLLTASLSALPARNFTLLDALILISAPV